MKTDSDLVAVRSLGAEPTEESLTRTWYRMTKPPKRIRPRSRVLAPVAVAAVVLALVGGSLVVYRTGAGVYWPVASTPDTVATLKALADKAAAGAPVTIGPGQVVHTSGNGVAGCGGATECVIESRTMQLWYDVHAGRVVNLPEDVEQARTQPEGQESPVGVHRPTLEWLATLPTDPEKLLAHLRIEIGRHDRWTVDGQLWDMLAQMYSYCELALTPAQRANLLRAFTGMSGLSTRDIAVDGRSLIAIRHTDDTKGKEILFDPDTGRVVGRASYFLGEGVTIINPFDVNGVSRMLWTQSVVPTPQRQ
ncbi:CU044_5270 family protein [Allorhizocola rhizosphaerae]|uniref:CU044_5270 family protein n=1 Tax=Allorhizocola rhizosphaerae TaxID=1872709 RepID=UPI000E3BCAAB|nr:CU044_5270 family protein [Allorhizocola rhizosphaerae]